MIYLYSSDKKSAFVLGPARVNAVGVALAPSPVAGASVPPSALPICRLSAAPGTDLSLVCSGLCSCCKSNDVPSFMRHYVG